MVYVEPKKKGDKVYYYHTRGIRIGESIKKIRKYVGTDREIAYSLDKFKNSIQEIAEKELDSYRKDFIEDDLTYSNDIIKDIFKENIIISNLKEFDKNIKEKIEYEFPIKFIFNSNSIEGSRISQEEVEKILTGKSSTHKNRSEVQEVKNSQKSWEFMKKDFNFNVKSIKELHAILTKDLKNLYGDSYVQGFKKVNIVVGQEAMPTTEPKYVKEELKKLLEWYKENKNKEFTPKLAFDFYYRYELIHPFEDGNGRTGRYILNKILVDNGYQPVIVFENNRESHHRAFLKAQNGHMKYLYDFMFKQYKKTFEKFYSQYY